MSANDKKHFRNRRLFTRAKKVCEKYAPVNFRQLWKLAYSISRCEHRCNFRLSSNIGASVKAHRCSKKSRKNVARQSERKSFYILIRWLTAPRKWMFYGHPNHMAKFYRYYFYAKCNLELLLCSLMLFLAKTTITMLKLEKFVLDFYCVFSRTYFRCKTGDVLRKALSRTDISWSCRRVTWVGCGKFAFLED